MTHKIRIFALLLCLLTFFLSCNNYLEEKPYDQIIPETSEDYATLIYAQLQKIQGSTENYMLGFHTSVLAFESYTDNLNANISIVSREKLNLYVGQNISTMSFRWLNLYKVMVNANIIINEIPESESDVAKRTLAIAYALRAHCNYNLMREFCEPLEGRDPSTILGLPIIDKVDIEAKPARKDLRTTLDFIISDLKTAIELNQTDTSFVYTADVAKALLAKVYFWGGDWSNTIPLANEILQKYPLIEGAEYKKMLQSELEQSGNILMRSYTTETSNTYRTQMNNAKSRPVNMTLIKLFEEKGKDIRYTFFFDKKYLSTKGIHGQIRSAEMCLMLAECYFHLKDTDKSLQYLNMLREKRISDYTPYTLQNLPPVDINNIIKVDATGTMLTPLISAILNERRKEFFMEGDRWFELKRNGRPEMWVGMGGKKYATKKYLYTFPISRGEFKSKTNLIQNPGYEKL